MGFGFRVEGLGLRVLGLGFWGFRVCIEYVHSWCRTSLDKPRVAAASHQGLETGVMCMLLRRRAMAITVSVTLLANLCAER